MKAIAIEGQYGLDHLKEVERLMPNAGPGEIVIKMKAASLNYRDLMTVSAMYGSGRKLPLIPLSDGAGEVVEVGDGVTRVKQGDLVCPSFFQAWISGEPTAGALGTALGGALDGVAQEYMCLPAEGVSKVPSFYRPREAATLPCAALTAWRALFVEGAVKPGDSVLVQGTGGVSIFALQFAKAAGATVIVTSSSDAKLERARTLGADHLVNYKATPDWAAEARRLTHGRGVDYVVDVGGAGTAAHSIAAACLGGHVAMIGVLTGFATEVNVAAILSENLTIKGITVGPRCDFEAMVRAIEATAIRPIIDQRFPLAELPNALRHMQTASHFGKLVIDVAD